MVKKALVVWGNFSSDFEELEYHQDASMIVVKDEEEIVKSLFSLMSKTNNNDIKEDVTLLDLKSNINTYSIKRLRKHVVIDYIY